jgi:hypothetical protein
LVAAEAESRRQFLGMEQDLSNHQRAEPIVRQYYGANALLAVAPGSGAFYWEFSRQCNRLSAHAGTSDDGPPN